MCRKGLKGSRRATWCGSRCLPGGMPVYMSAAWWSGPEAISMSKRQRASRGGYTSASASCYSVPAAMATPSSRNQGNLCFSPRPGGQGSAAHSYDEKTSQRLRKHETCCGYWCFCGRSCGMRGATQPGPVQYTYKHPPAVPYDHPECVRSLRSTGSI